MTEEEPEVGEDGIPLTPPLWKFPICAKCGGQHAVRNSAGNRFNDRVVRSDWLYSCSAHVAEYDGPDMPWTKRLRPCKAQPYDIGTVCKKHGGFAPWNLRKMAERKEDARLMERLRLELVDVDPKHLEQHPIQGLLEGVGRSAQAVHWLAQQVAKLHVADPSEGLMADLSGFDGEGKAVIAENRFRLLMEDHAGDLKPHPYWKMLNDERERHARLCKLALDAGVNERLVNLAQAQAVQMVQVLVRTLTALGMSADKVEDGKRIMAEIMRSGQAGQLEAIEAKYRVN